MKYSIVAIGDELLAGQVVDTNSGSLARMLEPYGWQLSSVRVVADDASQMRRAMEDALAESRVVVTTGGLGPTKDDRTKQVLLEMFGGTLVEDPSVLENVRRVVAARTLKLNALTAAQAMVPTSCRVIQNLVGTAPIMWFEREGRVLVAMPGVPFETLQMMQREVLPRLMERFPEATPLERRTVVVMGVAESAVAQHLDAWEKRLPQQAHLAYLPKPGVVRLRIDVAGDAALADELKASLLNELPSEWVMATDDLTPEQELLRRLISAHLKIATAESCTGGTIAQRITAIAGASAAMVGGVVAYANEVKVAALGVNAADIETHGAVSQQVVEQMALGAMSRLGADIAVATSGIAGPGGGTPKKPVGTVWMAVATASGVKSQCCHLPGTRDRVIDRAATNALLLALRALRFASRN
jgi:nicotinamide-nucleotide amidase